MFQNLGHAARVAAITISFLLVIAITALAQDRPAADRRQNASGQFDFFVLALS